ncbi:MAG TPA: ATP-binding protein [Streptosporangiaceae bacterium]|nr:ATP-binding protein [Streptosporangiaceae bacterium]
MTPLIGRRSELTEISAIIATVPGRGRVVVIAGDPGIGKSALLAAAEEAAHAAGHLVLTVVGIESEAQLPFAGLHQMLRPVLRHVTGLQPAHQDALMSALGLGAGQPPELFLVALAALNLVAEASLGRPVAVVADDVQWLDPPSQEALAYMARRAAEYAIVVIGAIRTGHPSPFPATGSTVLELGGVDEVSAGEILRAHAGTLSQTARLRIQREAEGNPLALIELPAAWTQADAAAERLPTLSARLERAFAGRMADLPARTRDAVLVAATDPATDLGEILRAASVLSRTPASAQTLDPAVEAGLLRIDGGHVRFRHPLVRSGVVQGEGMLRRQAANAALAEVLTCEPYRRTWHKAQSIVGPDDQVADELEANVAIALSRGGVTSAIRDLQRSAELTTRSAARGHRLLMAAEHAFGLGRADLMSGLIAAAARTQLSELDWARLQWLREIFNDGVPGDARRVHELCRVARRSARAGDTDLALNLLVGAALRCWWADAGPVARAAVAAATTELAGQQGEPRYIAALAVAEPVLQCSEVLRGLAQFRADEVSDADALRLLGMAAHAVGDTVRCVDFLSRAETMLRAEGRLGLLSHVLSMLMADRLELGEWDEAVADEGERLAKETGQPIWRTGTLFCDALRHAFLGHADQALAYAAEVELIASRHQLNDMLSCVQRARGAALASMEDHRGSYRELRRLFDPADPSFHQRERYGAIMLLADAAAGSGQAADARQVIAGLEEVAARAPSPMLSIHLAYARAVLADDDHAPGAYAELMGLDLTRWPWARGRAWLAYGRWLARQGAFPASRQALSAAERTLDRIGARTWARQAGRELAALQAANGQVRDLGAGQR